MTFFRPALVLAVAGLSGLIQAGVAVAVTIRVGGTGSALGTMRLLADGYRKIDPTLMLEIVPNLGTAGGIQALGIGAVQIAVTGRPPTAKESTSGLTAIEYGVTPFVLATTQPGIEALTLEQVAALYDDRQAMWGDRQPVRLVLRPARR